MTHDVVVVAASAGGVRAIRLLLGALPATLPAAVLVVLHIPASPRFVLADILNRCVPLPVRPACDGEALSTRIVLLAPPDRHLTVDGRRLRLSSGEREHGVRPAADPLLCSAAAHYGARVVAVVLSGTMSDGARGAARVAAAGGVVLTQDPREALCPQMPEGARLASGAGPGRSIREIASTLVSLSSTPDVGRPGADDVMMGRRTGVRLA